MIPHEGHDGEEFLAGCPACEAEREASLEGVEVIAGMAVVLEESE